MAEMFYGRERDEDFYEACEQVRAAHPRLSVSEIARIASECEAKSFYLQAGVYARIIRSGGKPSPKNPARRALYAELLRRAAELRRPYPELKNGELSRMLSEQEAPRFYLSARRSADLYYALLRSRRGKRPVRL
jgi:hypothetical protein